MLCCSLVVGELLGEGAFGKVYKGYATGLNGRTETTVVAVKMLRGLSSVRFFAPFSSRQHVWNRS